MSIHIIENGNIFKVYKQNEQIKTIAHGCNMTGIMGAGIALTIKNKFNGSYVRYRNICKLLTIGELYRVSFINDIVFDEQYKTVYNLYNVFTQEILGANLDLIDKSMTKVLLDCQENEIKNIVIPAIGCGIGGLEFEDVYKVLKNIVIKNNIDVDLYMIKNYVDIPNMV